MRQAHEVEVGSQQTERLRLGALRFGEHDEVVPLAESTWRLWHAGQQRQAQPLLDLLRRTDARVECLPQEREPDPQHDPERQSQDAVAHRSRLDSSSAVCRLHRDGVLGQQRHRRVELGALRQEAFIGARPGSERLELLIRLISRARVRKRVEPGSIGRERHRIGRVGEPSIGPSPVCEQ